MIKTILAGAITSSLLCLNAQALSVGNMQVDSYLGEPLDISIDLNSINENEFSTLDVSLASREMFSIAGIEYPDDADKLKVELGAYDSGQAQITIKTAGAVSDPFIHLLLKISWSGGNILREYTALIDPADYKAEPASQAVSPETSIGITQAQAPAPANVQATTAESEDTKFRSVKSGESLSSIAALYRPADVSIQQAWVAFYNLNKNAFSDNNLNSIIKGAQLQVPSDAQMRAISTAEAIKLVKDLTQPLDTQATEKKPVAAAPEKKATVAKPAPVPTSTLVVGGNEPAKQAEQASAKTPEKMPEKMVVAAPEPQVTQLSDLKGYDQLASIVTELGSFTQTIKQEISDSRDRDDSFKEELAATRGENKILTDRMERLEAQLSRMSQLLELQSSALQSLSTGAGGEQTATPGLSLNQLETVEAEPAPAPEPAPEPEAEASSGAPKTYYEQLLDQAISDAPEQDKSYIEEVLGLSSTSIGLQDTNPVTPEMEAQAAAAKPAAPAVPADQGTETMLANVRAALGNQASPTGTTGSTASENVDIGGQDLAYIDALNEEDRSQIQKSETRIAELERELQAKIKAAQTAGLAASISTAGSSGSAGESAQISQPAVTPVRVQSNSGTDIMTSVTEFASSVSDRAKPMLNSASTMLSGVSTDVWRLVGGIGIATIGFMVIMGNRRRRAEDESPDEASALNISVPEEETQDIAELAARSMEQEPEELDMEEELHGSSLFDLSDESFMASEAIQDDSSLFSMDDDEDSESLTDMDSTQLGNQSTMTQTVDVDPIAEADVYLAYDRKEQAIDVLDKALTENPNQSAVVIKLLELYKASDNSEGFSRLFESSAEHIEDDDDWNKIKLMAQEFVPGHDMLADDFDSSIPVLMDEVKSDSAGDNDDQDEPDAKLELASDGGLEPLVSENEPDESQSVSLDAESDVEDLSLDHDLESAVEEVNQHEPDTALALAKAYIELGETDIAKDFLKDVINGGSDDLKSEAEKMLASMG